MSCPHGVRRRRRRASEGKSSWSCDGTLCANGELGDEGCRSLLRLENSAQYALALEPRGLSVKTRADVAWTNQSPACSVRSRYRRCLCLPTSCLTCLSICQSVLRMRHALERGIWRNLVFACEAVWILGLNWLKLATTSWCLQRFGLANTVRGHVQEAPPRPVSVLPASAPPSALQSSLQPTPFLPQHNTMHSTLSTTSAHPSVAQQHRATHIASSLSNENSQSGFWE